MPDQRLQIRDLTPGDERDWRALWAEYLRFYRVDLPPDVTGHTWRRLLSPASELNGRVATAGGVLAGFAHSLLHESSWSVSRVCYLEDLYVAPACRGMGIGRALIGDLIDRGCSAGWSAVYWHTQRSNTDAARLYDRIVPADDFVRYKVRLPHGDGA